MENIENLTIKYFKAVPISEVNSDNYSNIDFNEITHTTIKKGFLFDENILKDRRNIIDLINKVENNLGPTIKQKNSSFHKSWNKIRHSSDFDLYIQQLVHYITTYGFQQLSIFNDDSVYIPNEKLDIPKLNENYYLTFIKGLTNEQIKERVLDLFESGIALKEETSDDLMKILKVVGFDFENDMEYINNKEVRIKLYLRFDKVPKNPEEFLRLLIYSSTGESLLIKSNYLIEKIKQNSNLPYVNEKLNNLDNNYLIKLSSIFNRYKPLFLAFKNKNNRNTINTISKLSKSYHIPMPEDYLNSITEKISNGETIDKLTLEKELNKVNCFRKIRLLYALYNKIHNRQDFNLYLIRNGKSFVKEKNKEKNLFVNQLFKCSNILVMNIVLTLSKNVKDKTIYIPKNIEYMLPTSEKQFTGNIPNGSYVRVKDKIVFGIHWFNVDGNQTDLDLALINSDGEKIGWNTNYRNQDTSILFSGDMTNAPKPNGASELFHIEKPNKDFEGIVTLNNYSYGKINEVNYSTWVGKSDSTDKDYVFNQNNIAYECESKINQKQTIIGMVESKDEEFRYYFTQIDLGESIVSSSNQYNTNARKVLLEQYKNKISLRNLLELAGAKIVNEKIDNIDINLDFRNVEKDTFINLFID